VEPRPVTVGVDVGQRRDPTAIVGVKQDGGGSEASREGRVVVDDARRPPVFRLA
jgi:hypothetical protein